MYNVRNPAIDIWNATDVFYMVSCGERNVFIIIVCKYSLQGCIVLYQ